MASRGAFSPIIGGINGHPANQGMGRSYGRPSVFDTHGYEYKWDDKLGDYVCWVFMDSGAVPFLYKNVKNGTSNGQVVSEPMELVILVSYQSLQTRALKNSLIRFHLNG